MNRHLPVPLRRALLAASFLLATALLPASAFAGFTKVIPATPTPATQSYVLPMAVEGLQLSWGDTPASVTEVRNIDGMILFTLDTDLAWYAPPAKFAGQFVIVDRALYAWPGKAPASLAAAKKTIASGAAKLWVSDESVQAGTVGGIKRTIDDRMFGVLEGESVSALCVADEPAKPTKCRKPPCSQVRCWAKGFGLVAVSRPKDDDDANDRGGRSGDDLAYLSELTVDAPDEQRAGSDLGNPELAVLRAYFDQTAKEPEAIAKPALAITATAAQRAKARKDLADQSEAETKAYTAAAELVSRPEMAWLRAATARDGEDWDSLLLQADRALSGLPAGKSPTTWAALAETLGAKRDAEMQKAVDQWEAAKGDRAKQAAIFRAVEKAVSEWAERADAADGVSVALDESDAGARDDSGRDDEGLTPAERKSFDLRTTYGRWRRVVDTDEVPAKAREQAAKYAAQARVAKDLRERAMLWSRAAHTDWGEYSYALEAEKADAAFQDAWRAKEEAEDEAEEMGENKATSARLDAIDRDAHSAKPSPCGKVLACCEAIAKLGVEMAAAPVHGAPPDAPRTAPNTCASLREGIAITAPKAAQCKEVTAKLLGLVTAAKKPVPAICR